MTKLGRVCTCLRTDECYSAQARSRSEHTRREVNVLRLASNDVITPRRFDHCLQVKTNEQGLLIDAHTGVTLGAREALKASEVNSNLPLDFLQELRYVEVKGATPQSQLVMFSRDTLFMPSLASNPGSQETDLYLSLRVVSSQIG